MQMILLLLLLVPLCTCSQTLQTITIDKLTGDTMVTTTSENIYNRSGRKLDFVLYKSKLLYQLAIIGRLKKDDLYIFKEGSEMNIKLSNSEVVTLQAAETSITKNYRWRTRYTGSREGFEKLRNNNATFIRLHHTDNFIDYDISEKNQGTISRNINLIMQ